MKTIRKKANHISKVDLNVHVDSLNSRNSHTDSFFFKKKLFYHLIMVKDFIININTIQIKYYWSNYTYLSCKLGYYPHAIFYLYLNQLIQN